MGQGVVNISYVFMNGGGGSYCVRRWRKYVWVYIIGLDWIVRNAQAIETMSID